MQFLLANPLIFKGLAILLMVCALVGGKHIYDKHYYNQGYAVAKAEAKVANDKADATAKAALEEKNRDILAIQTNLDALTAQLQTAEKELENAKIKSASLEADLRSGAKRLSVLVTAHKSDNAQQDKNFPATCLDNGTITADLDGTVAANLERLRLNENNAIMQLNGCVKEYEALERAVNTD